MSYIPTRLNERFDILKDIEKTFAPFVDFGKLYGSIFFTASKLTKISDPDSGNFRFKHQGLPLFRVKVFGFFQNILDFF